MRFGMPSVATWQAGLTTRFMNQVLRAAILSHWSTRWQNFPSVISCLALSVADFYHFLGLARANGSQTRSGPRGSSRSETRSGRRQSVQPSGCGKFGGSGRHWLACRNLAVMRRTQGAKVSGGRNSWNEHLNRISACECERAVPLRGFGSPAHGPSDGIVFGQAGGTSAVQTPAERNHRQVSLWNEAADFAGNRQFPGLRESGS